MNQQHSLRKRILCDWLGAHKVKAGGFDGVSFSGRCQRCGSRCLQDSQGGWFRATRQDD